MALTPQQRILRAKLAAHALHATGNRAGVNAMNASRMARYERQVDPEGKLMPPERRRRAEAAMRSHMHSLALKSSVARSKRKAS